jgi:hypothetical protein
MRYWGFLVIKLFAAAGLLRLGWFAIVALHPEPDTFMRVQIQHPFARDLSFTFVALLYWLFSVGLMYVIVLDHRYRCRTCLRRLRMPVDSGGWDRILLLPPRTDYICPYGHGTLTVKKQEVDAPPRAGWEPIEDMWKELRDLEESRK